MSFYSNYASTYLPSSTHTRVQVETSTNWMFSQPETKVEPHRPNTSSSTSSNKSSNLSFNINVLTAAADVLCGLEEFQVEKKEPVPIRTVQKCTYCMVDVFGGPEAMNLHESGKKHIARVKLIRDAIERQSKPKKSNIAVKNVNLTSQIMKCETCNICCSGATPFDAHNKSKKHLRNVKYAKAVFHRKK